MCVFLDVDSESLLELGFIKRLLNRLYPNQVISSSLMFQKDYI